MIPVNAAALAARDKEPYLASEVEECPMPVEPCAIGAPDPRLLSSPLEYIVADHHRQRSLCRLLAQIAEAPTFDAVAAAEALSCLERDLPVHVLDEEEDLFPLLRRRATAADDVEGMLGLLSREHAEDDRTGVTVGAGLRAALDASAAVLGPEIRDALRRFADRQRRHIAVENAVVMPLAELRLTESDREALARRMAARRGVRLAPSGELDALFDRNAGWALGKTKDDPGYFRRLAAQQSPRFLWIGCSDSRVPANEIVGLDPGELFVHRNIANVMHTGDLNLLSVLEFAVDALRVEHIIVCGHYGCGGVRRALQGRAGALVDHWLSPVVDVYERQHERFDAMPAEEGRVNLLCELNVEAQVARVANTPIIKNAWAEGRPLQVHGWIYGLKDGLIRDLGVTRDGPEAAALPRAPRTIDAAPVDDWSDHIRLSALKVLEGSRICGCPPGALATREVTAV